MAKKQPDVCMFCEVGECSVHQVKPKKNYTKINTVFIPDDTEVIQAKTKAALAMDTADTETSENQEDMIRALRILAPIIHTKELQRNVSLFGPKLVNDILKIRKWKES